MFIVSRMEDFLTYAPKDGAYAGFARMNMNTKTNTIAETKKYAA